MPQQLQDHCLNVLSHLLLRQPRFFPAQMVQHSLTGDYAEGSIVCAPKLLEVVLQCCQGRVDQWIQPYLSLCLQRLATAEKRILKDALIAVVANALYYNAALTLAVLQSMNATQQLLASWFTWIFERRCV